MFDGHFFSSSHVKNQLVYIYNCEKANEILNKNSKIFTWKKLYHAKFRNEFSLFFLVGLNNVLSLQLIVFNYDCEMDAFLG